MGDDHEPRSYWEVRVEKAKREGTWDNPPAPPSGLPKGASAATAAQSFWQAVTWIMLGLPRLALVVWEALTQGDDIEWVPLVVSVLFVGLGVFHGRSWRILRTHEAEHGVPTGQEKADRRTKVIGLVVIAAAVVLTVVVLVTR